MDTINMQNPANNPNQFQPQPKPRKKMGCLVNGIIGVVVLFIILVIIGSIFGEQPKDIDIYTGGKIEQIYVSGNHKSVNKIALIKVNGVIFSGVNSWDEMVNADSIASQIYAAQSDPEVKAIILEINSPGGEVSAADKIYNFIQNFRKTKRPVIALFDSMAASGGYYIAAQTDWIVSGRLSITGSIGVIIDSIKYYDLLSKVGVQDEVYKTGEFKDLLNGGRPTTLGEKELLKNMIGESYNIFVDIVSKGRISKNIKLTPEYIKTSEIGDGRVFSGQEALQLGLVDQIGYYSDALNKALSLAKLHKDDVQIVMYEEKLSFSQILGRLMMNNFKMNLEIPGISRNSVTQPGNFYYLYR
ncbi:MAG: hypothetical protein A2X47_13250 [Lentisphaerae bacterium GWF2_38_69]|nr:MAG: hypothetical protein A2X47_13250 [Lentisphaerae bacterium GWF2_38_69]